MGAFRLLVIGVVVGSFIRCIVGGRIGVLGRSTVAVLAVHLCIHTGLTCVLLFVGSGILVVFVLRHDYSPFPNGIKSVCPENN